jgi:SAM-dependent methyltransferase
MAGHGLHPYSYDALFYEYIEEGARRSARAIVPIAIAATGCRSVLDVGCGAGAWLSEYANHGIDDFLGVDGEYVDRARLLIPADRFKALDVSAPFAIGRRFDLVQCLETAEHVRPDASRTIVANLAAHGDRVLFSAAVPGQGGEHHVNERPYEFWRALFAERAFAPFDAIRPRIPLSAGVEPWYAYNTILYVRDAASSALPPDVQGTRVPPDAPIPDVAPFAFRARKAVLRRLPRRIVSALAVLKHHLVAARRRRTRRDA